MNHITGASNCHGLLEHGPWQGWFLPILGDILPQKFAEGRLLEKVKRPL
jgi:hypothetical protein